MMKTLPPAKLGEAPPAFAASARDAWFAYAKATFDLIYTYPDDSGGRDE